MRLNNTDYYLIAAAETDEAVHSAENTDEAHASEGADSHGEESQGIAALGLDPFALGAQLLTFVVLFWFVKKFALGPIVKNLQKRNDTISRGLHLTAEMDKEKADLDEKVTKALRAARKDADAIVAEARAESGKIIAESEQSAARKADEILRAAEGKIERDIAEARAGLKNEMGIFITEATEAILGQKLDTDADRKLVQKYLEESLK